MTDTLAQNVAITIDLIILMDHEPSKLLKGVALLSASVAMCVFAIIAANTSFLEIARSYGERIGALTNPFVRPQIIAIPKYD